MQKCRDNWGLIHFKYPEGEKPPRPNHIKQMREHHEKLIAMGLGGLTTYQLTRLEEAEQAAEKNRRL